MRGHKVVLSCRILRLAACTHICGHDGVHSVGSSMETFPVRMGRSLSSNVTFMARTCASVSQIMFRHALKFTAPANAPQHAQTGITLRQPHVVSCATTDTTNKTRHNESLLYMGEERNEQLVLNCLG